MPRRTLRDRLKDVKKRAYNRKSIQENLAKELADKCMAEAGGDPLLAREMFMNEGREAGLDPATIFLLLQIVWKFYQWTKNRNQTNEALELDAVADEQAPAVSE